MVQPCRSCILEVQCLKLSALCNCYFAVVFALQVRKKISRTHAHDTLIEQLGGALRVCCQKHGSKRIIPTALRSNFRMHGDRRESPPPASVLRCGLLARLVAHFAKRETRTSEEFSAPISEMNAGIEPGSGHIFTDGRECKFVRASSPISVNMLQETRRGFFYFLK